MINLIAILGTLSGIVIGNLLLSNKRIKAAIFDFLDRVFSIKERTYRD